MVSKRKEAVEPAVRRGLVFLAAVCVLVSLPALATAGFVSEFGETGSGNGQFNQPFGVATDSKGNIWVVDTENHRVEKFNEAGEYLSQLGGFGSGNGQLNAPMGIAIDSSDNIWVVDSGNDRLQKFNAKGEYLGQVGATGSGDGQFNGPTGIALDNSDRPFVVDTGNNRVQKFNSSLKFLDKFGNGEGGNAEFTAPLGIEIDTTGRIWIADTGADQVQRINPSTFNVISKFGKTGTGNGEFNEPTAIVSDFQERLWVVDSGNDRAQKFDIEGGYLDQFGEAGSEPGQLDGPIGIAAPAPTQLMVVDSGNDRVQRWTVKAEPPTAVTLNESNLTAESATLNGKINPEALETVYWFEYGLTSSYGTKVPLSPESVGSGTSTVHVNQPIGGLSPGTTYHYRVVAESNAGVSPGKDMSLKTLKLPKATTEAASAIESTQATLNGLVNPEGTLTTYWFEYGTTTSYGTKIPLSPESAGEKTFNVPVSKTPTGLSPSTTYHFRVVAESAAGIGKGADKEFTTSP